MVIEMKITHLYHSGFCVELEEAVLIFDYERGNLPIKPEEGKRPVYIFASHVHPDHFHFRIFSFGGQIRYVLSHDIKKKYNRNYFMKKGVSEQQYDRICFLKAHEEYEIDGLRIRTLDSTDCGVAFLVNAFGKTIYHAGDLNWWSWEGESEADELAMERKFKQEIESLSGITIDAAFLTLDGRQEERFYLGFDYFMRHTDTRLAYPMHYWNDASVVDRLLSLPQSEPYRERIVRPGM